MTVATVAAYDRAVNRGAAVSAVGHVAILALGLFVGLDRGTDDPQATVFWLLALFSALGLVATLLAWASVRAGKIAWDLGVVTLFVSLFVLAWATTTDGGFGVLGIGIAILFADWLVFKNALKVLRTP